MRSECKECPWVKESKHNQSWKDYVLKMVKIGQIDKGRHACHMITSDVWGFGEEINGKNVCVGSCKTKLNDKG